MILAFPALHTLGADERHCTLVERAYAAAPDIVTDTLLTLIDAENRGSRYLTIHQSVKRFQDPPLNAAMLRKAQDQDVKETRAATCWMWANSWCGSLRRWSFREEPAQKSINSNSDVASHKRATPKTTPLSREACCGLLLVVICNLMSA